MAHRNKNLVFTNEDMQTNCINNNNNSNTDKIISSTKRKRKDEEVTYLNDTNSDQTSKRRKLVDVNDQNTFVPRRSARLANKKQNSIVKHTIFMYNSDESDDDINDIDDIEEINDIDDINDIDEIDDINESNNSNKNDNKCDDKENNMSTDKENSSSDEEEEEKMEINNEKEEQNTKQNNNNFDSGNDDSESSNDSDSSVDSEDDNTDGDEMSDFIVNDKKISSPAKKRLKKGIDKFISAVLKPSNTEEQEFDDIMEELLDEPWFEKLPEEEQVYYVERMRELRTPSQNLPTIKDIMDMNIDTENIKVLIMERRNLDEYEKLSPAYHDACQKFMKKLEYLTDKDYILKQKKIKELEKDIMNQSKFVQPLRDRILQSNYNDTIKTVIYDKYITMCESDTDDAAKYKTWIETVLSIPQEPKKIDLDTTIPQNEAISKLVVEMMMKLNEKVYGMEEAKEELLCIIANMMANPKSKHKAIGLYGPPGIGKTMIAKVLSEVLKLPMEQIALGGVTDSSFLEGHGFTYVGSEPGCIVKAAIKMKCTNGILYLDEVDKISKTEKGKEIEHSLLHITDFTQNHDFRDKYMPEIPVDLSDYIFIYSMNTVEELDSALASRIPVVKFDGYTSKQKIKIVSNYILPEILSNYGMIKDTDIILPDASIKHLIRNVKEEDELNGRSGVRGLKKALNRIINRINLYRLASINGKMEVKLSFDIPNFKLPYTVTTMFIDKIIKNSNNRNDISTYQHLYI
ncbi:hypothetical protein QJ857_gp1034 [Tupanvirus soda lake]|uniref:AAA+ ATPase domain-containing protein n=2 Tax=Tupanvirus TaxID=2094720 RepID=A0A6N1NLN0_9VIRU|nr:hypothetical protein QJ857_gp1034 [Tupanvirus soda lake]QKU35020.1 hypothetical protein [Tupanvirus soda lake]